MSGVEESIMRLSGQVSTLSRQQKYFRTRENRNFSTVHSTEGRIFNLNLMQTGVMIAMAALQVFVVKMFFTGGRKGILRCHIPSLDHADFWFARLRLNIALEAVLIAITEEIDHGLSSTQKARILHAHSN